MGLSEIALEAYLEHVMTLSGCALKRLTKEYRSSNGHTLQGSNFPRYTHSICGTGKRLSGAEAHQSSELFRGAAGREGKAFCVSPKITDAGGPFPEVAPAAGRCWDKAERGITAQQQELQPRNFQSARAVFRQTSMLQESHAWLLPD